MKPAFRATFGAPVRILIPETDFKTNHLSNMKKLLSLLSFATLLTILFFSSCRQQPSGSSEQGVVSPDSVGTGNWTVNVIVKDASQMPVANADVVLECASMSGKTNSRGVYVFMGEGSCPCSNTDRITISKEGMCSNVTVTLTNGCGATYNATCQ